MLQMKINMYKFSDVTEVGLLLPKMFHLSDFLVAVDKERFNKIFANITTSLSEPEHNSASLCPSSIRFGMRKTTHFSKQRPPLTCFKALESARGG